MPAQNERLGALNSVPAIEQPAAGNLEELFQKVDLPDGSDWEVLAGRMREPSRRITLASGREVELSDQLQEDLLTVSNPQGEVELSIRFTPAGPVLNVRAAAINLRTPGEMNIACGRLTVQSAGDVTEEIGGEKRTRVEGKASFEAHTIDVKSLRGNITAKANDDVCLLGERIKLNS